MKANRPFEPRDYDYGPATASVRAILEAWMAIDWFAPGDADAAIDRLHEHQRRAHAYAPDRFPAWLDAQPATGSADAFADLCARVRANTARDWRLGELKQLSHDHAQACGWSAEAYARARSWPPRDGDLFTLLPLKDREAVIYTGCYPRFDTPLDDAPQFYVNYAHGDLLDACKWQLALGGDDTSTNPFVPLLESYARGGYPFSLDPARAIVFTFTAPPG